MKFKLLTIIKGIIIASMIVIFIGWGAVSFAYDIGNDHHSRSASGERILPSIFQKGALIDVSNHQKTSVLAQATSEKGNTGKQRQSLLFAKNDNPIIVNVRQLAQSSDAQVSALKNEPALFTSKNVNVVIVGNSELIYARAESNAKELPKKAINKDNVKPLFANFRETSPQKQIIVQQASLTEKVKEGDLFLAKVEYLTNHYTEGEIAGTLRYWLQTTEQMIYDAINSCTEDRGGQQCKNDANKVALYAYQVNLHMLALGINSKVNLYWAFDVITNTENEADICSAIDIYNEFNDSISGKLNAFVSFAGNRRPDSTRNLVASASTTPITVATTASAVPTDGSAMPALPSLVSQNGRSLPLLASIGAYDQGANWFRFPSKSKGAMGNEMIR